MMLTPYQVKNIQEVIVQKGFSSKVNEEILDHCCSKIEEQLTSGITYENALKNVLHQEYIDSLKTMNKKLKIIHFSKFIYMKISILALLVISLISFSNFYKAESEIVSELKEVSPVIPDLVVENKLFDPPEIWPLSQPGKVSSGFGMRVHPIEKEKKFHFGIDIPAALGTPVIATSGGIIVEAGYTKSYGNYIVIKHDETFSSKYSQLFEINVTEGEEISKGDPIGTVGSSGRSTAPHLHFEVIESGKHVDPMKFIKA